MILEGKFIIPPLFAFVVIAEQALLGIPNTVRIIIDLAALCILAAGFLVLGRLRAALAASESAAEAWKEERNAAVAKAERITSDLIALKTEKEEESKNYLSVISQLQVEITRLQERPSLDVVVQHLNELSTRIGLIENHLLSDKED